jgi:hypothetical protein
MNRNGKRLGSFMEYVVDCDKFMIIAFLNMTIRKLSNRNYECVKVTDALPTVVLQIHFLIQFHLPLIDATSYIIQRLSLVLLRLSCE